MQPRYSSSTAKGFVMLYIGSMLTHLMQEILLHENLKIHAFSPAENVAYYVLPCSKDTCSETLHPEGLHAGLFMFDEKTAYDHQLLFHFMDDMRNGGTEIAAYSKLQIQYERIGISSVASGLPSLREFRIVYRQFSELCATGLHSHHTGKDGVGHLFECPICGPPEAAALVMDGTASEYILVSLIVMLVSLIAMSVLLK